MGSASALITNKAQSSQPVSPPQKTGVFCSTICFPQLTEIVGEHSLVTEALDVLKLPPFPQARPESVPPEIVLTLIRRHPLLVRKERDKTFCIGNIRLYRLAKLHLEPKEPVPTIEYIGTMTRSRKRELLESLLIETFLLPAVFGRRDLELRALVEAYKRAESGHVLDFWPNPLGPEGLYRIPSDKK